VSQLADRIAALLREHGLDPAARQSELHALSALEASDVKLAHERFLEMKRALLVERRAQLLGELRRYAFARGVPSGDATRYPIQEIESDVREAARALGHARQAQQALDDEDAARRALVARPLAPAPALTPAAWTALAPLVEIAESRRRAARRELRVEERSADLARRAARVKVAIGDISALDADSAHEALDEVELRVVAAERLAATRAAALAPLADPAVREWRRESMRGLEREIREAREVAELAALRIRAEALRKDAAAHAEQAARARRSGRAPPERERRTGDALDPYG
jgi:hypothetical protein